MTLLPLHLLAHLQSVIEFGSFSGILTIFSSEEHPTLIGVQAHMLMGLHCGSSSSSSSSGLAVDRCMRLQQLLICFPAGAACGPQMCMKWLIAALSCCHCSGAIMQKKMSGDKRHTSSNLKCSFCYSPPSCELQPLRCENTHHKKKKGCELLFPSQSCFFFFFIIFLF